MPRQPSHRSIVHLTDHPDAVQVDRLWYDIHEDLVTDFSRLAAANDAVFRQVLAELRNHLVEIDLHGRHGYGEYLAVHPETWATMQAQRDIARVLVQHHADPARARALYTQLTAPVSLPLPCLSPVLGGGEGRGEGPGVLQEAVA